MRREQRQTSISGMTGDIGGLKCEECIHLHIHTSRHVNVHKDSITLTAIFTQICGECDAGQQTDLQYKVKSQRLPYSVQIQKHKAQIEVKCIYYGWQGLIFDFSATNNAE